MGKLLLETSMGSNDRSFEYPPFKGPGPKSRKKHHRGRSLLEIKNEVSQRNNKLGNVVFGQGLSKDMTNDISRSQNVSLGLAHRNSSKEKAGYSAE